MICENYAYPAVAGAMPRWHCLVMDNLARIREARGLSQTQLAEMIGANQGTISKIESGAGNPTLAMINKIAKALRVHPSQLSTLGALQQRAMDAIMSMDDEAAQQAAIVVLETMARRSKP